jgi:hypothetical protein
VTVEVDVSPDAEIGPVSFRLLTPLGTSPEGRFLIEPYYGEAPDREPNDSPDTAFETFLPAILAGTISRPGDTDFFKIQVKAGQQLSFLNQAMLIGSSLQPVVSILDAEFNVVREFGADGAAAQTMFGHRFETAGTFYIRVADYQRSGRASHFYRIVVGEFPWCSARIRSACARARAAKSAARLSPRRTDAESRWQARRSCRRRPPAASQSLLQLRARRPGCRTRNRIHRRRDHRARHHQQPHCEAR